MSLAQIVPPTLIFAGPWHCGEFPSVRDPLDPTREWPTAPTLGATADRIPGGVLPPELVFLAQPRPGCDEQAEVERLRVVAPLTRLVVVAGSWCEGELRTGRALTGVVRLYWYELPGWWRASLALLAEGKTPPWSAPLDDVRGARSTSRALDCSSENRQAPATTRIVAINADDYSVYESLAAALSPRGWQCQWQPSRRMSTIAPAEGEPRYAAGIFDGGQLDAAELTRLAEFCEVLAAHRAPVIALLDFPRAEHLHAIQTAGAVALLAKPYQVEHLLGELSQII